MGHTAQIIGYLVLVPVIAVFGIIGNLLTLVVLVRGPFQSAAYTYLKGLAVFDALGLIFILPICAVRCPVCDIDVYSLKVFEAYIYIPVGDVFLKASIWTTVVFTVERCLIICFQHSCPLEAKTVRSAAIALIVIAVVVALENLPSFWQHEISVNGTVQQTEFAGSTFFTVYGWLDAALFQFIPLVVLLVFNVILVVYLCGQRESQRRLRREVGPGRQQRADAEQGRVMAMLLGIVVLFLSTMVPSSILQLLGYSITFGSEVYVRFQVTVTVLITCNFACNFLLYCALNPRFRKTFKTIICFCSSSGRRIHPQKSSSRESVVPEPSPASPNGNSKRCSGSFRLRRQMARIAEGEENATTASTQLVSNGTVAVVCSNGGVKALQQYQQQQQQQQEHQQQQQQQEENGICGVENGAFSNDGSLLQESASPELAKTVPDVSSGALRHASSTIPKDASTTSDRHDL